MGQNRFYCTCSKTRLTENVFPLTSTLLLTLNPNPVFEMTSFFEKVYRYRKKITFKFCFCAYALVLVIVILEMCILHTLNCDSNDVIALCDWKR